MLTNIIRRFFHHGATPMNLADRRLAMAGREAQFWTYRNRFPVV